MAAAGIGTAFRALPFVAFKRRAHRFAARKASRDGSLRVNGRSGQPFDYNAGAVRLIHELLSAARHASRRVADGGP
jgi:hypothetical protein